MSIAVIVGCGLLGLFAISAYVGILSLMYYLLDCGGASKKEKMVTITVFGILILVAAWDVIALGALGSVKI